MPVVPFLVGPTASGKTALALLLARRFKVHLISADSRQIYRWLDIGTAKPTLAERSQVVHHFVDCLDPQQTFSAGEFSQQARAKIAELSSQDIIPLIVGGSGLYISALADDFFSGPSADREFRDRLRLRAQTEGIAALYQELIKVDPVAARTILPGDYRRLERALEIYALTGMPISYMRKQKSNPPSYQPLLVGLAWSRPQLYDRINLRCQQMLDSGFIQEVNNLLTVHKFAPLTCPALDSVGYHEVVLYLKGAVDYEEMVRLFQRNSRRFAKRQISWFKRDSRIHWVERDDSIPVEQSAQLIGDIFIQHGIKSSMD